MNITRLTTSDDELFLIAMELYQKSFPIYEQRSISSQKNILKNEEYHFDLICHDNALIGIVLSWETQAFIYIEHFCINPQIRNKGYGQKILELLSQKGKTIILEIDPPVNEIAKRRKAFYERAQYKANDFKHVHPPYQKEYKGHDLVIMSYPNKLLQEEYYKFNQYLKENVMNS